MGRRAAALPACSRLASGLGREEGAALAHPPSSASVAVVRGRVGVQTGGGSEAPLGGLGQSSSAGSPRTPELTKAPSRVRGSWDSSVTLCHSWCASVAAGASLVLAGIPVTPSGKNCPCSQTCWGLAIVRFDIDLSWRGCSLTTGTLPGLRCPLGGGRKWEVQLSEVKVALCWQKKSLLFS